MGCRTKAVTLSVAVLSESFPPRLPRHGERLPDRRPTHVALAKDVDDVLHGGIDPLKCTVVSGEGLQQCFGRRVIRQQRVKHLLRCRPRRLLVNDCLAELHAFVANEHARSSDKGLYLGLRLRAEGTTMSAFAGLRHGTLLHCQRQDDSQLHIDSDVNPMVTTFSTFR